MNDNANAEPQVNIVPQVFAEQVAILHRHSSLSLVTTAIATLLVVMLLYDPVPLAQTAIWAAALLATTAFRGVIVQRYRAAAGQGRSTQTWMRDFCVGLSATSILWGVAAAAFLTTPSISARFGLLTILAVIPALSIPALGGHRVAFSLFVFPMLVPMAITLLRVGDHIHVALALATAVYGAVLWVMGRRAHQSTIESLTQRFDKEALLEQVITAREAAELARLGAEEARVAAEDANRAKSMFLATMSHEIRTPMNGVLGMNELLLRTELTTRQRHFADTVQRSGMQLLAIINDVLDFSKVEAGRLELEAVPIDLRQLADDVLETYVELASRQGIALRSEMDPALAPALLGDPTRLRQILASLLSNALKFTAQGEVLLRVSLVAHEAMHSDMRARAPKNTPGQTLLLQVRDTGIGIAADAQACLFKAFSQADGSTTRRYGGTGLGLAIARDLVTLMSGEIWVTSTPGSGSTFHVQVHLPFAPIAPLAAAPGAFATQESLQPRDDAGTGVRGHVLLVEDNDVNRLVASEMLHALGYVVTEASNGADALKRWQDGNCDIVLMDCQMPDMDGLEATRRIRTYESARAPRSHTPIVALTANALLVDREACLAAGMDDHLAKPFSLTQLDETIGRWIDSTFRRT